MVRRALVVGADDARGLLAAVRSLAANRWHVGVLTPSRRSLAASSRYAARWHPLDGDVVSSVARAVAQARYDVVLPGGDAEMFALSERREDVGCVVPYGSRESVRCVLDKVALASAAAGLGVPATRAATDESIAAVDRTVVLKSRSHATVRAGTVVSADRGALRDAAAAMRAAGAEPVLQDHVTGPLVALSVVVGDGVVAAVQQRSHALWPPDAGISTRAETVPVDAGLLARVERFLTAIGWRGLAQCQFLDGPDGPRLIDVNGRLYGSLALASAAGVDLAAVWASVATGEPYASRDAEIGVRYQWLYGDLRHAWRTTRTVTRPLAEARRSTHSVWDPRDPLPAVAYVRSLARR